MCEMVDCSHSPVSPTPRRFLGFRLKGNRKCAHATAAQHSDQKYFMVALVSSAPFLNQNFGLI